MKNKMKWFIPVLLLTLIDQTIKIYISNNLMHKGFDILGSIVGFKPYINIKFSWINSLGDFGINLVTHIILNVLVLLFLFVTYGFVRERYAAYNKLINYALIFMLSGGICSLIDKVVWGGSLDYIWLKGFFIFDLKDVYLSTSVIMIIFATIINNKAFKKINDKEILHEFIQYIKRILPHK